MKLKKKQVMFLGSICAMINSFSIKSGIPTYWVSPWMVAVPFGTANQVLESFRMKNAKTLWKQAKIIESGMNFLESIEVLSKQQFRTGTQDSDGRTFEYVYSIRNHEKIKSLVKAFYSLIGNKVNDLSFERIQNSLDEEEKPKKRKIMKKSAVIKPASKVAKAKKATSTLKKAKATKKA